MFTHFRLNHFFLGQTLLPGLLSLGVLIATTTLTANAQGQTAGTSARSFRALAIACDLPDGLRLTINGQPVPTRYPTGKVTNLSAFLPGTYSITAESPGCLPLRQQLVIQSGKIHTWVFYTTHITVGDGNQKTASPTATGANENSPTAHTIMVRDLTAPAKINQPATALIDLTGTEGGISLLLNRHPVSLTPIQPKILPARIPGTTLELAEPGHSRSPFFSQKVDPGNHALVAIFRMRNGQLSAVMKTL